MDLKRTPLYQVHKNLGARMTGFGGWDMPVSFAGINKEHLAVRRAAGIFDVSHMGQLRLNGPAALGLLQKAACNDAARLAKGAAQYSAILNEQGGIIDDVFIYRIDQDDYLLCVNAANRETDYQWLKALGKKDCRVDDESEEWALIAVQGPRAEEIMSRASGSDVSIIRRNNIAPLQAASINTMTSRTGYTGEDGFEVFVPCEHAVKVWDGLMEFEEECGLQPCGLGARDTLRLEMGYPLHGHDITTQTTPVEADLQWIVAMYKKEFPGKKAIERQIQTGISSKRAGLVMQEPGVPREGCRILTSHGEGRVTSGTKTPSLESPVAMGYVPLKDSEQGTEVEVEIRGKNKKALIQRWPFYRGGGKRDPSCEN